MRCSVDELANHIHVALFRSQVERVEAVRVAGVDVDAVLDELEHLLTVARTSRPQEHGVLVARALNMRGELSQFR